MSNQDDLASKKMCPVGAQLWSIIKESGMYLHPQRFAG
jgi:hypothetical protein